MPNDAPPPSQPPTNLLFQFDDAIKRTNALKSIVQANGGLFTFAREAAAVCNRLLSYETFITLTVEDIQQLADASFAIMVARIVAEKPRIPDQVANAPKLHNEVEN